MTEKELLLPENETERLIALQSYHIMDSGEEQDFDAIASIASAICHTPISLITFIDGKRQWFKSHIGTELKENFRDLSFCTHAIAGTDDLMIVPDATQDERFANNPVVSQANVTFYAGVPLVNEDGYALGTLCVMDLQSRNFTELQTNALKALGKQVVDKMELRRKVLNLEKSNQDLLNANVLIQKFASMAAHDIKNPLSSIKLTSQALKMRHEKLQDDGFLRLVNMNITATDNLLTLVDEMLAYSKNPNLLLQKKQQFELNGLLQKVLSLLNVPDDVRVELPPDGNIIHYSLIAFEQIIINLLSNAIRYNDQESPIITIAFAEDELFYHLEIKDNGIGIPDELQQRIFENNFTINAKDRFKNQGSGIGLSTVKDLLSLLDSEISVKSEPGKGSAFTVRLKK